MREDSLNLILVIGESYIKWHSQLYGYYLPTSPHLMEEKKNNRLFVFNNVLTPSNLTTEVMKNLLCCNSLDKEEEWYEYPLFPVLFKQAGYNVYFWDNQKDFTPMATYSFTLNSFLYHPDIRRLAYNKTNINSYDMDGGIVEDFKNEVKYLHNPHNLIIFHLQGQHHDVETRFPNETFTYFTADSIKQNNSFLNLEKKKYIANYDNATRYNDYVIFQIINIFKDTSSIIVYLSDHGEEVYDYRDQAQRDQGPMTPNKLRYQYEIPFMVWCSDSYIKKHPETVKSIQSATNRPFMSDNLCHMLFHLGGINTSYYLEDYDLIGKHYRSSIREIRRKEYGTF